MTRRSSVNSELGKETVPQDSAQPSRCGGYAALGLNCDRLLLLVKDGVPDVSPKLLYDVEDPVQCELLFPPLASLRPGAILRRVIEARDSRCGAVADNFRKVNCRTAAIRAWDSQSAESVSGALKESATAQREVPRILPERPMRERSQ